MSPAGYVFLSVILFVIGAVGVLIRRNAILIFMSVELMLNACNLAFVAFSRMNGNLDGQVVAFFVMVVAAAEVVVGLGIIVAIRRLLRAAEQQRIRALVMMLCVTVLFFSWTDVVVAKIPGQFVDLHSKTDAVYFSVSTLATVGFGDVHPSGELARAAVTIQILFNLVFLGAAVATISGLWRQRTSHRLAGHRDGRAEEHGGG